MICIHATGEASAQVSNGISRVNIEKKKRRKNNNDHKLLHAYTKHIQTIDKITEEKT